MELGVIKKNRQYNVISLQEMTAIQCNVLLSDKSSVCVCVWWWWGDEGGTEANHHHMHNRLLKNDSPLPLSLSFSLTLLYFLFLLSPSILPFLLQHAALLALLRFPFLPQLELFGHLIFKDTRIARSVLLSLFSLSIISPSLCPYSLFLSSPPVSLPPLFTPVF